MNKVTKLLTFSSEIDKYPCTQPELFRKLHVTMLVSSSILFFFEIVGTNDCFLIKFPS